MSDFARFMKGNKAARGNVKKAVTKSLCDDSGEPLVWELRHISSAENEELRESSTVEEPVPGRAGAFRPRLHTGLYMRRLIAASIVMPDLYNAALQDSYGVKTPEDLLLAMVDDPGEYAELAAFVQKLQGFDTTFEDKVKQAKN